MYGFVSLLIIYFVTVATGLVHVSGTCSDQFKCEYHVLQKLILMEEKLATQDVKMLSLESELQVAKATIAGFERTLGEIEMASEGTTYIRWGRTTCPGDAQLVYDGYAAGANHAHTGTATNILCLPTNPDFDQPIAGSQSAGKIYGAEYETNTYESWKHVHDHDVPCAVCRVPRTNVLMVPGKNLFPDNFTLEYKGYLMADYYTHPNPSEFVCVDSQPEVLEGGASNKNGRLFYFVEAVCGSLKCPPYVENWELTCAVCSYAPKSILQSQTSQQQ